MVINAWFMVFNAWLLEMYEEAFVRLEYMLEQISF